MNKTISPPATIRIPQNCVIIHGDLVAIKPDYVIGVVNKINPDFMDISVPMTIIEDKIMHEDANTMRPDVEFTSVTNAKTVDRPKLSLSGPDPRPDSDYDPEQLHEGIKVEMEHTDDSRVAAKIAKDHLEEDARYYTHLIEMEEKHKNDEVKGRL